MPLPASARSRPKGAFRLFSGRKIAPISASALACLLLATVPAAAAQTVVVSPPPESLEVTVYRDPNRHPSEELDLRWIEGFALISEARTVTIPAGESQVRFEGVAGGIVPQSAIITGFPEGIVERNRDAYLLSATSLVERSLGRRVTIRRTSAVTGEIREQQAVIRSGADGAVVLQTADGYQALRCTGIRETILYDGVPEGLSARPTLSVRVRSAAPVTARVTLSYLASGFDWQANYVAELSPDGRRIDLFAWLTLASIDETSFPDASAQAVAGRVNRRATEAEDLEAEPLQLRCWPLGRTSDIPTVRLPARRHGGQPEDLINSLPQAFADQSGETLIVTAAVRARREDLGDLKLYRIPEPVTISANGQKQVALLQRSGVEVTTVYRARIEPDEVEEGLRPNRVLLTRNRREEGLGLPLPAGGVQLFAAAGDRRILLGEGMIDDRSVGEDVELILGVANAVEARVERTGSTEDWDDYGLTVINALPEAVRYEAEFDVDEDSRFIPRERLARRDGRPLWAVTVPANGAANLRYRLIMDDE